MIPELIPILLIFAITTTITCTYKFYQGIWNIHRSIDRQSELIDSQNDLIYEQNQLIKEYIELQKK